VRYGKIHGTANQVNSWFCSGFVSIHTGVLDLFFPVTDGFEVIQAPFFPFLKTSKNSN
jgi:hypothetical protein